MNNLDLFPYQKNRLEDTDLQLASTLHDLVEREVMDKRLELKEDYEQLLKPSMRKIFVDIGLQKMFWPEKLGGEGHNGPEAAYTVVAALEQVARADTGLAFLAAHGMALQASMASRGETDGEACARFAPLFCEGEDAVVVSLVLPTYAEGEGLTKWRGKYLQVTAKKGAEGWTLEGQGVRPTCSGADADLFAVLCGVAGEDGPALILVPGDAAGLKRGDEFKKTGLAASRNADLDLVKVKVPAENCILSGDEAVRKLLSWYYLGLAAAGVGSLLASYEILKEWGDTRVIKGRGQVFKENPLTAALMAQIAQDTALDRLLVYDLAGMLADPGTFGGAGSEAVHTAATMIVQHVYTSAEMAIHHVMELMASAGYAKEWQLERYWRDVKTVQCYLGASEIAKFDVARWFYQCETL
ncbi:MAG: acyl-CoA dehydrogenase family protein [Actinomycetota bacterium]|nr:acyl-CoA dehydrogenase family protein [Actinomycetota bacterium]